MVERMDSGASSSAWLNLCKLLNFSMPPFPCTVVSWGQLILFLEKAMATHSSTLAWKIPWTEEPGRLQSTGSLGVRHDWATSLSLFTFMHWRRKWQPTPVFLPGESQGRGAWWAAVSGVAQSQTWLKWLSSSSSSHGYHRGRLGVAFWWHFGSLFWTWISKGILTCVTSFHPHKHLFYRWEKWGSETQSHSRLHIR